MKTLGAFFAILVINLFCVSAFAYNFSVWDWPYQCHGDADGQEEGTGFTKKRVGSVDVAIIRAVYFGHDWPAIYPFSLNYDPCADFDRNFIVNDADFAILETWYNVMPVPADCGSKAELENISQTLYSNNSYTISWTWRRYTVDMPNPEDYPGTWVLYYSTDAGNNWTHIADISSTNRDYEWLVPPANSTQCLLKIIDSAHEGLEDTTYAFTIQQCQTQLQGDLNNDCSVNNQDLYVIAYYWLNACSETNSWCEGADFQQNNTVDFVDFTTFSKNWQLP